MAPGTVTKLLTIVLHGKYINQKSHLIVFFFETSHLIVKFSSRDVAAGALILKEAGGFVFDP